MFRRSKKLDARKVNPKTKRAILLEDLLGDEEKKDIQEEKEIVSVPQPEGKELTPIRPLPGAPKGMRGEVEEEYTPMSAAEITEKRKEHEKAQTVPPTPPAEEGEEGVSEVPPAFRDVMKNLLKGETPEGKKEQAQQAKYGPPEKIQETIDVLKEFHGVSLKDVDVETTQAIMARADLPDILKDRAQMLFDSRSQGDLVRTEQMALTSLKAIMPKQIKEQTEWLRDTPSGQKYMRKMFDKYRIGRVMSMLENTILVMEGQAVIDQPKREFGPTKEQRGEKKRLNQLFEALQENTITDTEFDDAKRAGLTLSQLMERKNKGKAVRLNMQKSTVKVNLRKNADTVEDSYNGALEESTEEYTESGGYSSDPDYMKEVGFPEDFKITDGYDFGASEGVTFSPALTIVDEYPPEEATQHQQDTAIITNLNEPIQLPPKPFISLKDVTPYLTNYDVVTNNIDYALLPGGTVFISSVQVSVDPYVDLLTTKGYQLVSDVISEPWCEGEELEKEIADSGGIEFVRDRTAILTKPGQLSEKAVRLNMRKDAEGDVTGPGGDSWEYEWTSGPTPTKDEPQKRKHRFPFHNRPSGYTPGEGDQGNLHDVGPLGGQSDMNYLANVIESMTKTADNDLFSIHSFDNDEKWLTYTLFKKAYSKFRPGDIVVQYGHTPSDCQTYRRRFGSVKKAKKSLVDALSPILATVVSKPTPDDSLHDLQKGKGEPGGTYGPRTNPYDQQPWQGNRDGFDAKNTPRQRTKRKFIPHMDQADDEGSGFMGGRTMGRQYRNAPQVSQMSLPELLVAHKPGGVFGITWGEPCRVRFEELTGQKWSPEAAKELSGGGRTMGKGNKRNIFADARLTPKGEAKLQELQATAIDPSAADLYVILNSVAQNSFVTNEEVYLNKAGDIEDVWHNALKGGLIISEDLPEDEEFLGELPGGLPEGIANQLNMKKGAMPIVETPEERAAVIEQPPVKPINRDQKRPFTPRKRYDPNEQQLTRNPNYMGEDSSGFDKERILLSMKKKKKKISDE